MLVKDLIEHLKEYGLETDVDFKVARITPGVPLMIEQDQMAWEKIELGKMYAKILTVTFEDNAR